MIDHSLTDLHPDLQPLCQQFLDSCSNANISVKITETFRDPVREDELHAKGITKATGATCKHCFMLDGNPASKAFDFALYNDAGHYIADGEDPLYAKAGGIATNLGLLWGGDFVHASKDWDHCELTS